MDHKTCMEILDLQPEFTKEDLTSEVLPFG